MLLRKQTALAQSFQATMEFAPSRVGYEAGIVLWWNQFSYATVGVTLLELPDGERVLTVVRRGPTVQDGVVEVSEVFLFFLFFFFPSSLPGLPRLSQIIHTQELTRIQTQTTYPFLQPPEAPERVEKLLAQGPVELVVGCRAEDGSYTLGLRQGGADGDHAACRAEDLTVAPPVGAAFTGVMFGVYAFGRGEPVLDPAFFGGIRMVGGE